ncbi:MAG: MarR family winged helix-turn-helix transcriptional regulator [Betaproteobacteria bacterium]
MNRRAAPRRNSPSGPGPRSLAPIRRVAGLDYDVLDELLGYLLRRAQVAMFMSFREATRGVAITPPRFTALVVIGANPGLSQTVLGNVLGIARSGAMLLADRFETQGLVERRHRADDGRAWGLVLTRRGEALVERLKRRVVASDRKRAAVLSARERRELRRLLAKLAA